MIYFVQFALLVLFAANIFLEIILLRDMISKHFYIGALITFVVYTSFIVAAIMKAIIIAKM